MRNIRIFMALWIIALRYIDPLFIFFHNLTVNLHLRRERHNARGQVLTPGSERWQQA